MAKYPSIYRLGLVAGYVRYIPCGCDGETLSECRASHWPNVHLGTIQFFFALAKRRSLTLIMPARLHLSFRRRASPNYAMIKSPRTT